jgi:F-type H+-transporting ATPase subunit epsilon
MYVEIITPDKNLFQGEVKRLKLPGTEGSFELLKGHAPIISALKSGKISITVPDGTLSTIDIRSGVIELISGKVMVLVNV